MVDLYELRLRLTARFGVFQYPSTLSHRDEADGQLRKLCRIQVDTRPTREYSSEF